MDDKQTNATDTPRKEVDKNVAITKEAPAEKEETPLKKLKTSNDEFEKELVRGRKLEAERQKLEANTLMGGNSGGNIKQPTPEEKETQEAQSMADEISGAFT